MVYVNAFLRGDLMPNGHLTVPGKGAAGMRLWADNGYYMGLNLSVFW